MNFSFPHPGSPSSERPASKRDIEELREDLAALQKHILMNLDGLRTSLTAIEGAIGNVNTEVTALVAKVQASNADLPQDIVDQITRVQNAVSAVVQLDPSDAGATTSTTPPVGADQASAATIRASGMSFPKKTA